MGKGQYNELFSSESLRGEKIHWRINWIVYPVLFLLSFLTYWLQGNKTAGIAGMCLSVVNLIYNCFLGYVIYRRRSVRVLSYFTITLNILSVTVYNYFDAVHNSPVLTATSAAILIYPIIIFLASLRMDRGLVIYATFLSCGIMNTLYFSFHGYFNLDITQADISADWISQVYRTVYLLVLGYLICSVPKSMRRVLAKQEILMEETAFHQTKAERDPLTSLYNRYFLDNHFELCREMRNIHGFRYALLYIDLNDFKMMNDTYGHDFGDFVLKSVGEDLNHVVRDNDIVARIGGDELVVVFTLSLDSMVLEEMAERISEAIRRPRTFNGTTLAVKASIGVALFPDHADSLEGLLKKADQAMYEIKKQKIHGVAYASEK